MSSKITYFLTDDNEMLYEDVSLRQINTDGIHVGNSLVLEISKKNIEILCNDNEDLIIEFKNPQSEIYQKIKHLDERGY
jgi:hypothetical protein